MEEDAGFNVGTALKTAIFDNVESNVLGSLSLRCEFGRVPAIEHWIELKMTDDTVPSNTKRKQITVTGVSEWDRRIYSTFGRRWMGSIQRNRFNGLSGYGGNINSMLHCSVFGPFSRVLNGYTTANLTLVANNICTNVRRALGIETENIGGRCCWLQYFTPAGQYRKKR